jgi:hypothetical protein
MLSTWSASVIGLSTGTLSGTVLPFSTIGGNPSLIFPGATDASPTSDRIASSIAASLAAVGLASGASTIPAAAAKTTRRVGFASCACSLTGDPPSPASGPLYGRDGGH